MVAAPAKARTLWRRRAVTDLITRAMLDFLVELGAFLRSSWKRWLQPILVFLLVIGGLLLLANALLQSPFSLRVDDTSVPFSRSDYRHDSAFFNRYSAISLCPSRFGWTQSRASPWLKTKYSPTPIELFPSRL